MTCIFDGCDKPAHSRQLCNGHLNQFYRGQTLRPLRGYRMSPENLANNRRPYRPCEFPGCDRDRKTYKRWCGPHRKQQRKGHQMRLLYNKTGSWTVESILARCKTEGEFGCLRLKPGNGYPNVWHESANWKAHRLTYHLSTGEDIDGIPIHHKCANKWCVNPEHLQMASNAENTLEMMGRRAYEARIASLEAKVRELESKLSGGAVLR